MSRTARLDPRYRESFAANAAPEAILALVDMALEDEQVPASIRQRVIRTVVYGSPSPADAIPRREQLAQMKQDMLRRPW